MESVRAATPGELSSPSSEQGGNRLVPHWRPTGWFQIGWSADFPHEVVRPLHYFGRDLVAYRSGQGTLTVLEAHCRHLGGHLGYGGRVEGDCVVCPFHGWHWGPDGTNRYIAYQPDRPNRSRTLQAWSTYEHAGVAYLWHDSTGGPPQWQVPDIFVDTAPHVAHREFHEPTESARINYGRLTLHPQLVSENAADPIHFRYVHGTRDHPVFLRRWERDALWFSQIGFGRRWIEMDPSSHDGDTLSILVAGVGLNLTALSGSQNTVILLSTTPVDAESSELLQTVWLEKLDGDDVPGVVEARLVAATAQLPNDIEIWQHQIFEDPPALASREGRAFADLRRWARQFYPADPSARPLAGRTE